MSFLSFLGSRLIKALLVILCVIIINFFLIRMAPGDPASVLAGQSGSSDPAYVEQLRSDFGLDKPLLVQLGIYLKGIANLDLGYSYRNHLPVMTLILQRLPATLLLMATGFLFSLLFGVLLAVVAAHARYSDRHRWVDSVVTASSLVLYATPLFWLALMAILLFSVILGWLPGFGMENIGAGHTGWARFKDI